MGTHTPGPWFVWHDEIYAGPFKRTRSGIKGFRACIGSVDDLDVEEAEQKANARLIAAAPELLEALRKLSAKGKAFRNTVVETRGVLGMDEHDIAIAVADAAITKATGAES